MDLEPLMQEIAKHGGGIKRNDDGSLGYVIIHEPAGEAGSTLFRFSEIERLRRSEFNSFVEVVVHHGTDIKKFSGRLNLASMSSREGFVRSLERITGRKKEFDSHLSTAIEAVNAELNNIPRSQAFTEIEPITGNMMLFHPFITDKSANLVFGDGSSTKSYICIHLAISLVTGLPFAGYYPARKANVLFLDYEDVGGKFADRVNRVAGGMSVQPSLNDLQNLRYMKAKGVALHEMVPQLKEEILKHNIELLIIDSAAYACGAEIEKADAVIRYFNALEQIGIASLAIAHVTKSSTESENRLKGQQHAIGSIYFHNGPRNIWNVVKQGDENDQEPVKKVCMFHRKCNDATLSRFVPLEVDFSEKSVTRVRVGKESDWEEAKDLASRIVAFVRTKGLASKGEVEDEFPAENKNTIKVTLYRLKSSGRLNQLGGSKGDYTVGVPGQNR